MGGEVSLLWPEYWFDYVIFTVQQGSENHVIWIWHEWYDSCRCNDLFPFWKDQRFERPHRPSAYDTTTMSDREVK